MTRLQPPLRVGLAGVGVVGQGLVKFLAESPDFAPAGRTVVITGVSGRRRDLKRDVDLGPYTWFDDAVALAKSPDIDVLVEVIGG
eukprot:gene21998-28005_t